MAVKEMANQENPLGLKGIAFVEYASPDPQNLNELFKALGCSKTRQHTDKPIDLYTQNDIRFVVNRDDDGFAASFRDAHGPSIPSMGFWVDDADQAFSNAVERGARPVDHGEVNADFGFPAIFGIGDSLVYFIDDPQELAKLFVDHESPEVVESKGFHRIDHLTNNVFNGNRDKWSDFYKDVFGFAEIRYFDIKGKKTGLTSYALKSPCGTFSLPINESTDDKSQISEYLEQYNGEGIQHIALLSEDLLGSLDAMEGGPIDTLDIMPEYYESVFDRVPNVTEDHSEIERHNVLVDGDEEGYLLQIFTKNAIGPIFFELIQRKDHHSFGEGNFQALFESIERDQERRGVI